MIGWLHLTQLVVDNLELDGGSNGQTFKLWVDFPSRWQMIKSDQKLKSRGWNLVNFEAF